MDKNTNDKKASFSSLKGIKRAVPLLLLALAAFLVFCFATTGMGLLGDAIAAFLLGSFSWGAYFIPAFIAVHALLFASDVAKKRVLTRSIFSLITLVAISSLIHAAEFMNGEIVFSVSSFYEGGTFKVGGGAVGGVVAFLLSQLFGKPGVIIISILIFALYITYYFASGRSSVSKAILSVLDFISDLFTAISKKHRKKREEKARQKEAERLEKIAEESDALLDDEFFMTGGSMKELKISELGISESRDDEELERNPHLHDKVRKTTTFNSENARVYEEEDIPEYTGFAEGKTQKRRRINLNYSTTDSKFGLSDKVDFEVFEADGTEIIYEDKTSADTRVERAMYGLDENAEDVFTKDFSAYDFKLNQEIASKKSSKATVEQMREPVGIDEFSEPLFGASEEAIEKARMRADFEMRKKAVIEERRKMESTSKVSKILTESGVTPARQIIDDSPVSMQFDDGTENIEEPKAERTVQSAKTEWDLNAYESEHKVIEDTFEFGKKPEEQTPPASVYSFDSPEENSHPSYEKSYASPYADDTHNETNYVKEEVFDYGERPKEENTEFDFSSESDAYTGSSLSRLSEDLNEEESVGIDTKDDAYAHEENNFKPFTAREPEVFSFSEEEKPESLTLSRSMLTPTPSLTEKYDSQEYTSSPLNTEESKSFDFEEEKKSEDSTAVEFNFEVNESEYEKEYEEDSVLSGESEGPESEFEDDIPDEDESAPLSASAEMPEEECFSDEEIPEEEQNEDVKNYRNMYSFLKEEDSEKVEETMKSAQSFAPTEEEQVEEKDDTPPFDIPKSNTPEAIPNTEKTPLFEYAPEAFPKTTVQKPTQTPKTEENKPAAKPDYSDYKFPPIELLAKGNTEEDPLQSEERAQNAEKLIDTLNQFGVKVSIKGIDHGPRITRYEIVPARGVKVNQVTNLFDDIALNMAAEGIRMEAPIPGKSAIGVEIPNKHPSLVLLRDLIECDEFINAKEKTTSCLGKDVTGNPVFCDIAKMPHMLIAGATGMGKSVCINSILLSILYKARPDEVKFIMIDPKKVEFNGYNGIPHLLVPVVTDVKQAAGALTWAVEQMEKRYELMEKLEVRKLDSYNERVREDPSLGEPLPKIIIVIDELNDIMLQVKKPAEDLIMSIAQKARAAGIHLIIGTQRPSVDVITGVIKANIPSRIACKVASFNDSKTILEQAGAEKLLKNGDMLYIPAGAPKAQRVQGAFVSDPEIASVMKFLKSQVKGPVYDESVLEDINRAAQKCSKGKGSDDDFDDDDDTGESTSILRDQQFLDAAELAIKQGKISTSLIQRKISVGYGKAAKFIDYMEELGLVSEPNGQRPRDVLITRDEWHEMLARRELD